MLGRPGPDETRRSRGARRRGGRLVGLAAATGAFVALGLTPLTTAPAAHADIEDLFFDPIVDAVAQAVSLVDPDFAAALDPGLDVDSLVAPALAAGDTASVDSATIPLEIFNTTEPLVSLSVGGGPATDVVVDTGSNGLVLPWWDVGWQTFFQFPTDWGFGAYSGGMSYFYLTYDSTVDFGNDIVTAPTDVNVALFSWPISWDAFFEGSGADGVLGIAADAVGPNTDVLPPTAFLPGDLGNGVLIDMPGGQLVFGDNPLTGGIMVDGVADANLQVSIGGGPLQSVDGAIIDSGGVYGTIPSSLLGGTGQLPDETVISVYTADGQPLYDYTTSASGPTVISGDTMNTGYYPFIQQPIYISYSPSTTYFGGN